MRVEVQAGAPAEVEAGVVAVLLTAEGLTETGRALDATLDGLLSQVAQDGEARSGLGSARLVHADGRRVVVAGGGETALLDVDGLRTAASAVVGEAGGFVESIAWPI
ncbi:MAG TPA: M17 family peptidase N-terminal domain-containing protein, partial [Gaiellaceae bacterium]|nr:M17 family peptidase N-terminal domain-containing protein [Gaiellaceae bacterium]